jgi:hypothetical protein
MFPFGALCLLKIGAFRDGISHLVRFYGHVKDVVQIPRLLLSRKLYSSRTIPGLFGLSYIILTCHPGSSSPWFFVTLHPLASSSAAISTQPLNKLSNLHSPRTSIRITFWPCLKSVLQSTSLLLLFSNSTVWRFPVFAPIFLFCFGYETFKPTLVHCGRTFYLLPVPRIKSC